MNTRRWSWAAGGSHLARHEGSALLPAATIVLKALLETEVPVELYAGAAGGGLGGPFGSDLADDVERLALDHGLHLDAVPTGGRAIEIALAAAMNRIPAAAWVPRSDVSLSMRPLQYAAAAQLPRGAALVVLLEDAPRSRGAACPVRCAREVGLPLLMPAHATALRDDVDVALRMSRAARRTVAIAVHAIVGASSETIDLWPNRSVLPSETSLERRRARRRPVPPDASDVLRVVRRAELNVGRSMPSPGERLPVGFVTVGPADASLAHLVHVLELHGRVPTLHLGAVRPIDPVAVSRLLERCAHVVVLEPRPGTVEQDVLAIAEDMRSRRQAPAQVWGRVVPGAARIAQARSTGDRETNGTSAAAGRDVTSDDEPTVAVAVDDAVHPSLLARRIVELLHVIRPSMRLTERLVQPPGPWGATEDAASHAAHRPEANETAPADDAARSEERSTGAPAVDAGDAAAESPASSGDTIPSDASTGETAAVTATADATVPVGGASADPVAVRGADLGVVPLMDVVRTAGRAVDQWLRQWTPREDEGDEGPPPPGELLIDAWRPRSGRRPAAILEVWSGRRFAREGQDAVRHAVRDGRPWVLAVCDMGRGDAPDPARLARAAAPDDRVDRVEVRTVAPPDHEALVTAIRGSLERDGLTILVVREGAVPVVGPDAIERSLGSIDGLGYAPRQEVVWSIDRLCAIRPEAPTDPGLPSIGIERGLESRVRIDRVADRPGLRLRLRVRPLREQVVVVRSRAPFGRVQRPPSLVPPRYRHATAAAWRAHVAGYRGGGAGVVPWIMANAGARMGYHVRMVADATAVGPGRRAWSEMLFTRPRPDEAPPGLVGRVPFGEADLVLGLDPLELLRAIGADTRLRVSSRAHTALVANVGPFLDESASDRALWPEMERRLPAALEATVGSERFTHDFAAACRARFHTDRLVDVAVLGSAFQLGLVPITVDAINAAVAEAEASGWGRLGEAFRFGREVAIEPRLLETRIEDRTDQVARLARRSVLLLRRRGRRRFATLVESSIRAMPGLFETASGRQAMRDFIVGLLRAEVWGGYEYARAFADRVVRLYRMDAPESGRRLTRSVILPMASAILVRDPFYVAALVAGDEHRRRSRRWLNIRRARADVIERRYLTRFELFLIDRRLRLDVRTSDWPARLVKRLRPVIPAAWRGTRRERALRSEVLALVDRAIEDGATERERWEEVFRRLHGMAVENRLRGMAISELKMLVERD